MNSSPLPLMLQVLGNRDLRDSFISLGSLGREKGHATTPNTVNQNELKFHLQVPHRSYIAISLELFQSRVFENEVFKHAGIFESVMLIRSAFSAFLFTFPRIKTYGAVTLHHITFACLTIPSYAYPSALLFYA